MCILPSGSSHGLVIYGSDGTLQLWSAGCPLGMSKVLRQFSLAAAGRSGRKGWTS